MPKENQRKHKRYAVNDAHGEILYPSDLNIININIDGAAIETKKRLELRKEYSFKVKYKDSFLHLKGLVVWSILSQTEKEDSGEIIPVYKAGIRFTNIPNENATMLIKFIEENKVETYQRRLGGVRVKIASSKDVKIDLPFKYEVKKISLSGMLIETERPFEINEQYEMEFLVNDHRVNVIGEVSNCAKIVSEDVDKYDIGIKFIEMSDKDKKILKSFLNVLEEQQYIDFKNKLC